MIAALKVGGMAADKNKAEFVLRMRVPQLRYEATISGPPMLLLAAQRFYLPR